MRNTYHRLLPVAVASLGLLVFPHETLSQTDNRQGQYTKREIGPLPRSEIRLIQQLVEMPPEDLDRLKGAIEVVESLTPEQKERLQDRIQVWESMSPEERQAARKQLRSNAYSGRQLFGERSASELKSHSISTDSEEAYSDRAEPIDFGNQVGGLNGSDRSFLQGYLRSLEISERRVFIRRFRRMSTAERSQLLQSLKEDRNETETSFDLGG